MVRWYFLVSGIYYISYYPDNMKGVNTCKRFRLEQTACDILKLMFCSCLFINYPPSPILTFNAPCKNSFSFHFTVSDDKIP